MMIKILFLFFLLFLNIQNKFTKKFKNQIGIITIEAKNNGENFNSFESSAAKKIIRNEVIEINKYFLKFDFISSILKVQNLYKQKEKKLDIMNAVMLAVIRAV